MKLQFTDQNFEEYLSQGKPVVIDFSATWCGPCRFLATAIEAVADKYDGKVLIGTCDVDDNEELVSRFGVRNVPAVFFMKGGEVVDKSIGAVAQAVLEEKIDALL